MQLPDLALLLHDLQRYYGSTYHGMTRAMGELWLEYLHPYPPDLVLLAVKRWAAAHLPDEAPTLRDLTGVIVALQHEQRQAWLPAAVLTTHPKETC